jgi:hypothetical protein
MGFHRRQPEDHFGERLVMPLLAALALESTVKETVDTGRVALITLLLAH